MKRIPPSGAQPGLSPQPAPSRLAPLQGAPSQAAGSPAPDLQGMAVSGPMARAAMRDLRRRAESEARAVRNTSRAAQMNRARRVTGWADDRRQLRRALRRAGIPLRPHAWAMAQGPHGPVLAAEVQGHWLRVDALGALRRISGEPVTGAADLMQPGAAVDATPLSPGLLAALGRVEGPLRAAPLLAWSVIALSVAPPLLLGLAGMGLLAALPWIVAVVGVWVMAALLEDRAGRPGWSAPGVLDGVVVGIMMVMGGLLMFGDRPGMLLVALITAALQVVAAALLLPELRVHLVSRQLAQADLGAPELAEGEA